MTITNAHDTTLLLENIDPQMALDQCVASLRAVREATGLTPGESAQLAGFAALTVVNVRGLDAYHNVEIPDDVPSLAEARESARSAWPELAGVLTALLVDEALDAGDAEGAAELAGELPDPGTMGDVVNAVLVARAQARILAAHGAFAQAVELLETELERLPLRNAYEALERLIEIHEQAGDLAAALATSKRLVDCLHRIHEAEAGTALRALEVHFRTDRAEAEAAQAREDSERDALTGVWNRRHLLRVAPAALSEQGASLAVLDVDSFKHINDELGHATGDIVLQRVAQAIRSVCSGDDVVARLGGDEFVVLRPASVRGDLAGALDPLGEGLSVPVHGDRPDLGVTMSLGVASSEGRGWDDTYSRADQAMYQTKRLRRAEARRR